MRFSGLISVSRGTWKIVKLWALYGIFCYINYEIVRFFKNENLVALSVLFSVLGFFAAEALLALTGLLFIYEVYRHFKGETDELDEKER